VTVQSQLCGANVFISDFPSHFGEEKISHVK